MSVTGLQTEGLKYAKAIFDTVRRMSADTLGVSRQGYSELETDVLHYLQGLGRDIGLEVRADDDARPRPHASRLRCRQPC